MARVAASPLTNELSVPPEVVSNWQIEERKLRLDSTLGPNVIRDVRVTFDEDGDFFVTIDSNTNHWGILLVVRDKQRVSPGEAEAMVEALDFAAPGEAVRQTDFDQLLETLKNRLGTAISLLKLEGRLVALATASGLPPSIDRKEDVLIESMQMRLENARQANMTIHTSAGCDLSAEIFFPLKDGRLLSRDVRAIADVLHYFRAGSKMKLYNFLVFYQQLHSKYGFVKIIQGGKDTFRVTVCASEIPNPMPIHSQVAKEIARVEMEMNLD